MVAASQWVALHWNMGDGCCSHCAKFNLLFFFWRKDFVISSFHRKKSSTRDFDGIGSGALIVLYAEDFLICYLICDRWSDCAIPRQTCVPSATTGGTNQFSSTLLFKGRKYKPLRELWCKAFTVNRSIWIHVYFRGFA